jgi:hypothetical protein
MRLENQEFTERDRDISPTEPLNSAPRDNLNHMNIYAKTIEAIDEYLAAPLPNLSENIKSKLRSIRAVIAAVTKRNDLCDRLASVADGMIFVLDDEAVQNFLKD